jgi:hypothetical protein
LTRVDTSSTPYPGITEVQAIWEIAGRGKLK